MDDATAKELIQVLCRIDKRLEQQGELLEAWARVADSLDSFRDEVRGAQRKTAETLVIARDNAERSHRAAQTFIQAQRESAAVEILKPDHR